MRDDRERLLDILEAVGRIEKYAARGREGFVHDELVQTWVVYHLQVIGEACRALSADLRERYPEGPWAGIVGMRNILVHHYFGIDVQVVWSVVEKELPELRHKIEVILQEMASAS